MNDIAPKSHGLLNQSPSVTHSNPPAWILWVRKPLRSQKAAQAVAICLSYSIELDGYILFLKISCVFDTEHRDIKVECYHVSSYLHVLEGEPCFNLQSITGNSLVKEIQWHACKAFNNHPTLFTSKVYE